MKTISEAIQGLGSGSGGGSEEGGASSTIELFVKRESDNGIYSYPNKSPMGSEEIYESFCVGVPVTLWFYEDDPSGIFEKSGFFRMDISGVFALGSSLAVTFMNGDNMVYLYNDGTIEAD